MADTKQDINNGTSQSRVVLAKPRLGGFASSSFGASSSSKSGNSFGVVLRPPQLKPGNNPFLKATESSDTNDTRDKETETVVNNNMKDDKDDDDAPKFVPLGSANVTTRTANTVPAPAQPAATSSSSFVFGQNLSERVVMNENVNNGDASAIDHSATNGTALLFTSAAASVKENNQEEAGGYESSNSGDGLAAAAAEYERSHARPPPPTTNYTTTGEEGENNILQISCRIFAWEGGSWRERGRGVLRLNDSCHGARLVARVAGSLRVVLNTKLWPDMVVERAGTKSLRITAADAQQQIKLFLIMGAPGDIIQLHRALTSRVALSKRNNDCKQNSTSQQAAERLEAAADANEYLDKQSDDEDKLDAMTTEDKDDNKHERLHHSKHKTDDECEVPVDNEIGDEKVSNSLKRKEPTDDQTPPKRQCPEILIE